MQRAPSAFSGCCLTLPQSQDQMQSLWAFSLWKDRENISLQDHIFSSKSACIKIFSDQVLGLSSTFQQQVCSSKSLFSDTSTQDCRIVCSNLVGCVQQKFIFSSLKSSSPPPSKNHLLLLSPETLLLLFLLPPETLRFLLSPLRLLLSSLGM